MLSCKHFLVEGHVQGVGYRAFALREAKRRNLAGWVRNLLNGQVEILAQGSNDQLEAFEEVLSQGSSHSRVHKVMSHSLKYMAELGDFCIEMDGDFACQFE